MTALADALADIGEWLPRAAALTASPDTAPTSPGGKPGSRPPWNQASANALWDALAVIADTEAMFRFLVTGRSGQRRPASATGAALAAIASLGHAVPQDYARQAARELGERVNAILRLPAIDEIECWERLRAGADGSRPCCPFCSTPNLRVAVRAGLVACVLPGCADGAGNRPVATMMIGAASGKPMVVWGDGTVQAAP